MINRNLIILLLSLPFLAASQQKYEELVREVTFKPTDGLTIYGDLVVQDEDLKTVLLFHQGGSNVRGEYSYTLPVLYSMGYNILAIDLLGGGGLFDQPNRTVNNAPSDINASYCDAETGIQAAIDYAVSIGLKDLILVGSSYTATLVIRVGAQNNDKVSGIMAFSSSSGGPMTPCRPDDVLENLDIPLLAVRPQKEMEIESVASQLEMIKSYGHQTYVASQGVHGSSMLHPDRSKDAEKTWEVVRLFLEGVED